MSGILVSTRCWNSRRTHTWMCTWVTWTHSSMSWKTVNARFMSWWVTYILKQGEYATTWIAPNWCAMVVWPREIICRHPLQLRTSTLMPSKTNQANSGFQHPFFYCPYCKFAWISKWHHWHDSHSQQWALDTPCFVAFFKSHFRTSSWPRLASRLVLTLISVPHWRAAHLIKTRYHCRYWFLLMCDNIWESWEVWGKFISTLSVDYLAYVLTSNLPVIRSIIVCGKEMALMLIISKNIANLLGLPLASAGGFPWWRV